MVDWNSYVVADTVGLGLTGLNGVVGLGDSVVVIGAANHCEGYVEI